MLKKPLLIYDGDCQFCTYWVNYWQKLTRDAVDYKPYQEVGSEYPSISVSVFQHAIQYVSPEGKIYSAAHASFLTLSHAKGKNFWLTLYQKLPGFSYVTEMMYAIIASHRSLFYRISLLLWGSDYEPPQHQLINGLFLRGLGLIYLSAFVSFGFQASGLIGSDGILPLKEFVSGAENLVGPKSYWIWPMLFWLNSSDCMIHLVCWGGAFCSILFTLNIFPRTNLILLSVFYLSLINAGQNFMTFQWDSYILETGMIAFFLYDSPKLALWLLRFLLFKFIIGGGLVKIWSGDITWRNFTALNYHFMTQPLPTPLAWLAFQLPSFILKIATAVTLFIELVMPFFIFLPRQLRFIGAYAILLLQTVIMVTGNYNFFNLLTILLCVMLLDDAALRCMFPASLTRFFNLKIKRILLSPMISTAAIIFAVVTIFLSVILFQMRFTETTSPILANIYSFVSPLRLVNAYGPFAVMTTERMEIIVEGSDDEIEWREYDFKYKPVDIYREPRWNIPHQPRLDWQMWFAALGKVEDNPWFMRFAQRLLENSPDVIALLETNPFPDHPPKYIRAQFYQYDFTTMEERKKTGAWWKRELMWLYLPSVHLK